jgi:hypothetical protein
MDAKGFWGTFIIFALAIGTIFLITFSFIFSLIFEINFIESIHKTILITLASAIFYSFIMARLFKKSNINLQIHDKGIFLEKLNSHLLSLRYRPGNDVPSGKPEISDFFTYKPPKGLLAGKIAVQINNGSSNITGPQIYMNFLQNQFGTGDPGLDPKSIIHRLKPDNIQNFVLIILVIIAINFTLFIFRQ